MKLLGSKMKRKTNHDPFSRSPQEWIGHEVDMRKAKNMAEYLSNYLNVIANKMDVDPGSMSKKSDAFCFIAKNRETKKFHGHAGMNIGDRRVAVTFQRSTIDQCEVFIQSWANNTIMRIKYQ